MKGLVALCIPLCVLGSPVFAAGGGTMSDADLEQSKKNMLESISNLTPAQWSFKPAPNVWSVAECAEHIVLAEDFLFTTAQQIMKTPAVERPESSNEAQDRKIALMVEDRSQKATAPEPITPSGRFATPEAAAREFTRLRDRNLAYARSISDELRTHVTKGPLGTMDAYQFLLLMAVHSARHTEQIREVESNAAYSK